MRDSIKTVCNICIKDPFWTASFCLSCSTHKLGIWEQSEGHLAHTFKLLENLSLDLFESYRDALRSLGTRKLFPYFADYGAGKIQCTDI